MIRFDHMATDDVIGGLKQKDMEQGGWELVAVVQPLDSSIGGAVPTGLRLFWKRPWKRTA